MFLIALLAMAAAHQMPVHIEQAEGPTAKSADGEFVLFRDHACVELEDTDLCFRQFCLCCRGWWQWGHAGPEHRRRLVNWQTNQLHNNIPHAATQVDNDRCTRWVLNSVDQLCHVLFEDVEAAAEFFRVTGREARVRGALPLLALPPPPPPSAAAAGPPPGFSDPDSGSVSGTVL